MPVLLLTFMVASGEIVKIPGSRFLGPAFLANPIKREADICDFVLSDLNITY